MKDHEDTPSIETLAPISTTALESITRGEIDIQISTAKRYPRSITEFKNKALAMVSMDEQTAESCFYSRPVGADPKTGKQKYAEGMSIRLAEIVAACYGNIRHGSFLVSQTDRQVTARGFAHDVESNVAATCEAVEATVTSKGAPFSERMRVVVAKAALAKADRDAIFKVVPRALCRVLEEQARKVAIGDADSIARRRASALQWAGKLGVSEARVFAALNVKGADDITGEHIKTLLGLKTALQDGDITVEEAFPHAQTTAFPGKPASGAQPSGGASGGGGAPEQPGTGPTPQKGGKAAKKGVADNIPHGKLSGTNEPETNESLPGVPHEPATGAAVLRPVSQSEESGMEEGEPADTGAAPQAERSPLRGRVSGAGQDQEGTLPGMRGEGSDAPRGLQQAAGSGLAVSEASSLAAQLKELLDAQGVTEAQALEVCRRNRIPVGDTLASSPVKSIRLLLKDVKTLVSESKK